MSTPNKEEKQVTRDDDFYILEYGSNAHVYKVLYGDDPEHQTDIDPEFSKKAFNKIAKALIDEERRKYNGKTEEQYRREQGEEIPADMDGDGLAGWLECFAGDWMLLVGLKADFVPNSIPSLLKAIKKEGSHSLHNDWTTGTGDIAVAVRRVLEGERHKKGDIPEETKELLQQAAEGELLPYSKSTAPLRNFNQSKVADAALHDPDAYKGKLGLTVFGKTVTVIQITPETKDEKLAAMPGEIRAAYRTLESHAAAAFDKGETTFEITPRQIWLDTLAIPKLSRLDAKTAKRIDDYMSKLGNTRIWIDASNEYGRIGERRFEEQPLVGFKRVYREYKGRKIFTYEVDANAMPLYLYARGFGEHGQNTRLHRAYSVIYDIDESGNVIPGSIARTSFERADIRDEIIDKIIEMQRMNGKSNNVLSLKALAEKTGARYDNKETRKRLRDFTRLVLINLQTPQGNGKALIAGFNEIKKNCAVTGYKIFLPSQTLDK